MKASSLPLMDRQLRLDTALPEDCMECESRDCAYNRDGICRFTLVFDRQPKITEVDGCTEFVIRYAN